MKENNVPIKEWKAILDELTEISINGNTPLNDEIIEIIDQAFSINFGKLAEYRIKRAGLMGSITGEVIRNIKLKGSKLSDQKITDKISDLIKERLNKL